MVDYVLKIVVDMSTTSPRALYTLPTPCRCLQVPQAPPMNTISNVEAARLCGSSIEWAVTVKESRALGSGITGVSATWLHRWTFPLLLQGAAAALAAWLAREYAMVSPRSTWPEP